MRFQIIEKCCISQTRMLDGLCQSAVNLALWQCFPGIQIQIYFFRLIDQSDQICCQRGIYCSLATHGSICCCQQTGCIINKRYSSAISTCDKSCQIGNNTTTYCQNTAVAAIAFFQHRILDHRLCLACLTFFSCREHENIGLISGIQQFLFQWTYIQRFHIAVCDNRKFMKFSNQTVCQIRYDEIQKSMSDLNLIGIIHYFF